MNHPLVITLVVYIAGLGSAAQFSKLAVSFVALSGLFPGQETQIGFAISLISAVGVCLGLFAGVVVSRIGAKRALVGALMFGAAISFYQATLPDLPLLMLSRVAEGLSHLLIVVAAPTLIADRTPLRMRSAALTLWSTFFGVAFAATALLAPAVIAWGGLSALLLGHGAWMVLAGLLCVWLPYTAPQPETISVSPRSVLKKHARAYSNAGIATPALSWLCYTLTFVSVLTALPLVTDPASAIWLGSIAPLVSIGVALTVGIILLARYAALTVLAIGFITCMMASVLLAAVAFSPFAIVTLFAAMGLVQGSGFAVVPQLNTETETRALANGALAQMGNLGNLVGTPILIALYSNAPLTGPVAFLLCAFSLGLVVTFVFGRRAQTQTGAD